MHSLCAFCRHVSWLRRSTSAAASAAAWHGWSRRPSLRTLASLCAGSRRRRRRNASVARAAACFPCRRSAWRAAGCDARRRHRRRRRLSWCASWRVRSRPLPSRSAWTAWAAWAAAIRTWRLCDAAAATTGLWRRAAVPGTTSGQFYFGCSPSRLTRNHSCCCAFLFCYALAVYS